MSSSTTSPARRAVRRPFPAGRLGPLLIIKRFQQPICLVDQRLNAFRRGVSRRPGETLFFGNVAAAVLERCDTAILFVAS